MLSSVSAVSSRKFPSGAAARNAKKPGEMFSISLDKELLGLLKNTMKQAGLDPARLQVRSESGRQNLATVLEPSQLLVAPKPPVHAAQPERPFAPAFQTVVVSNSFGGSSALNPAYFATPETAQWLAQKYGTGEVVEVDYLGTGGPYSASVKELHVRLANGRLLNAGVLADYYRRNPETEFPGLADKYVRSLIAAEDRAASFAT